MPAYGADSARLSARLRGTPASAGAAGRDGIEPGAPKRGVFGNEVLILFAFERGLGQGDLADRFGVFQ